MRQPSPVARFSCLTALSVFMPLAAWGQASLYTAGDPTASTQVLAGRATCASTTANMAGIDATSFSTYAASEFAAVGYELRGSVPNPMGNDTSAATAGRWGVTLVNPTRAALRVTSVQIEDLGGSGLFGGIQVVQPTSGWSDTNSLVSWTGTLDVPPRSSYSFIVQIAGRGRNAVNSAIRLRAVTAAGTLTRTDFVTSQLNSDAIPYVSLPFAIGGLDLFAGTTGNSSHLDSGQPRTFAVKVKESEQGNTRAIPAGSTLTITLPPGWLNVTAAGGQTGFGVPVVTPPGDCAAGSITVMTNAAIRNTSQIFQFGATAPPNLGGYGNYTFVARLQNSTINPAIDTRSEFVQEVSLPPSAGTRQGLTARDIFLAVPNPMGSSNFTTWGVGVANPLDTSFTVTSIDIEMDGGEQLFKAVAGIQPTATGWTRVSRSHVRWTGSVTIDPYDAANFMVSIQGNAEWAVDLPLTVSVNGGTIVKAAMTSQKDGNPPAANLYYVAAGQPAVFTYGVASGEPRSFQIVVKETQNIHLNSGTILRVVIPAGWSNVTAATNQAGFTTRTIVQPTATLPGEVRTTTSSSIKNASRTFSFAATSPPNLLSSLYVFPTTLTNAPSDINSTCDMLALVTSAAGGLEVQHLSPPIVETAVNQIDLHTVAMATPDTGFSTAIYNFAVGAWEPFASPTLSTSPTTLLGSISTNVDEYFDAPMWSTGKRIAVRFRSSQADNYRLDQDYLAFIISTYRVTPADIAAPTTFRGALAVPFVSLRFETDSGMVDLYTTKITVGGTDPLVDVSLVHLIADVNCNGIVDPGDSDLASAALSPDSTVTFGSAPTPLLSFTSLAPACAIIALDIDPAAGGFDVVNVSIPNGFDLTSSVGPLYPFPAVGGYPIQTNDVLIPGSAPVLTLDKNFTPAIVPPMTHHPVGTVITYSIDVSNLGEAPSNNVDVVDVLDAAWSPFTGVVTPLDGGTLCLPPTCPTARIVWPTLASIAGNATEVRTLRFEATIPKTVADGTSVPNVAAATSLEEPAGVSSNLSGLPVCAPVISVTKSLPPTPTDYAVGEIIQWTITVRNTGSCDASSFVLADTIDATRLDEASLVFSPATGTYDAASDTYTWPGATIAAFALTTFTVSGAILPAAQGSPLCNGANAVWDEAVSAIASDPPGGACTNVPVLPPRCAIALIVDKTLPALPPNYAEGEEIEWTITVRNNGNCPASGVTVRDTLDTSVLEPPYSFTPATGTFDTMTNTYAWPGASVAASGSEVLTYKVKGWIQPGTEGRDVCNLAVVSYDQGADITSSPVSGTCASVPIQPPRCDAMALFPATDLKLVKSGAGADITFSWNVTPGAPEHHLNEVGAKGSINSAKRTPQGVGAATCTGPLPGCTAAGAAASPASPVFYQAFEACGAGGDLEGPD